MKKTKSKLKKLLKHTMKLVVIKDAKVVKNVALTGLLTRNQKNKKISQFPKISRSNQWKQNKNKNQLQRNKVPLRNKKKRKKIKSKIKTRLRSKLNRY